MSYDYDRTGSRLGKAKEKAPSRNGLKKAISVAQTFIKDVEAAIPLKVVSPKVIADLTEQAEEVLHRIKFHAADDARQEADEKFVRERGRTNDDDDAAIYRR